MGGAGLIITEIASVHPSGSVILNQLGVYDDRFMPGLKRMVDMVHAAGSKVALQLHRAGRESLHLLQEKKAVAPSGGGLGVEAFYITFSLRILLRTLPVWLLGSSFMSRILLGYL